MNNNIKIPLPQKNIESPIKEDIKVRFITTIPYFGPGAATLLEAIEKNKSVSIACKDIKMSYSKGWKIIQKIKAATGYDAVITHKGGNCGGVTELTAYGKNLIYSFRNYEKDVKAYSKERFIYYLENLNENNNEEK